MNIIFIYRNTYKVNTKISKLLQKCQKYKTKSTGQISGIWVD